MNEMIEPELLMPDWLSWDGTMLHMADRRVPAVLDHSLHSHEILCRRYGQCMSSPWFWIWMENGAGLNVDVGYLDMAKPPRIRVSVHLYVQIPGVLHDEIDGSDIPMPTTPAEIVDRQIRPCPWGQDPPRGGWWCDVESGEELLRYVDAWGRLPVVGLNSWTPGPDYRLEASNGT